MENASKNKVVSMHSQMNTYSGDVVPKFVFHTLIMPSGPSEFGFPLTATAMSSVCASEKSTARPDC